MKPETREKIINIVDQTYLDDVESTTSQRSCCKTTSDVIEVISKILIVIASLCAFAAGFWKLEYLSFIAGALNALVLGLMNFASYTMNESKERTIQSNMILSKLKIDELVDITVEPNNRDIEI
jgi:hypothetical protein